MVRLRLSDDSLTTELVGFLRRCECEVEHLGPATVAVGLRHPLDLDAAVRQLHAGRCYSCGEEIESVLFRLGSGCCHDCREETRAEQAPNPARVREDWTRMEVEAYLRVWRALHPEGRIELVA
jgi:hypothetical protein